MKQLTLIKVAGVVMSLAAFGGGMASADTSTPLTTEEQKADYDGDGVLTDEERTRFQEEAAAKEQMLADQAAALLGGDEEVEEVEDTITKTAEEDAYNSALKAPAGHTPVQDNPDGESTTAQDIVTEYEKANGDVYTILPKTVNADETATTIDKTTGKVVSQGDAIVTDEFLEDVGLPSIAEQKAQHAINAKGTPGTNGENGVGFDEADTNGDGTLSDEEAATYFDQFDDDTIHTDVITTEEQEAINTAEQNAKTYADEAEADAISAAAADATTKADQAEQNAINAAALDATAKANAALIEAVKQAKEATNAAIALQAQLQAEIDGLQNAKIAANAAAIAAEAVTRAAEDALIRAELAEERADRIAADLQLQGEINHNRGRIQTLEDQWNTDPVLGNYDISKVTGQRVRIEVANGVFEDRIARVEDIKTIADRVADNTSRIQRLENAVFVDDKDSALDRLRADLQARAKSARANNAADYVMTSAGLVDLRAFDGAFTSHSGGVLIALNKTMAYNVLGLNSTWVALK